MKKNRPNYGINTEETSYAILGDNNLRRVFDDCFDIMLSSCYNDNTKSSRYFSKMNDDNTSAYYVHQKDIELQLDNIYAATVDMDRFLVGFTGIGKTTLLKNHFKIINANPFIDNNKTLVAYISVYSDDINNTTELNKVFAGFLQSIYLLLKKHIDFDLSNDQNATDFYNFIDNYKSRLLNNNDMFDKKKKTPQQALKSLSQRKAVQFYSLLIKYLVEKINNIEPTINQIFFVFDDIESQRKEVHVPFISKALNIVACLRMIDDRNFNVKSIISLRNYTFRYHQARQAKAKRSYSDEAILKTTIPKMRDIFEKRFQVYYDNSDVKKTISDEKTWLSAKETLESVVSNIADFGEMISSLAHYDISHSLKLFLQVLTNRRWFAPNEYYYQGAFGQLKSSDYMSQKERIFKALMYGENEIYVDNEDSLIPNILAVHEEENSGTELLSLFVLEYMFTLQRHKEITLYGQSKIKGNELRDNIKNILNFSSEKVDKLEKTIKKLYEQEYLLHSVFEPECNNISEERETYRQYDGDFGLYLSIRGNKVLDMLSRDSLLFEVLRDDIDTDLKDNNVPSSQMNQTSKLIYLISYCSKLFEIEKEYISYANKELYFKNFNNSFIIIRLLKGIHNTNHYFYKNEDDDSLLVKAELTKLYTKILAYANILQQQTPEKLNIDISFIIDFLKKQGI